MANARRRQATAGAIAWFHWFHLSESRHFFQSAELRSEPDANCSAAFSKAAPLRPRVTSFSTNGRSSFALGSVVTTRPGTFGRCGSSSSTETERIRLIAMFRNIALRWDALRPSFLPRTLCLIASTSLMQSRRAGRHAFGEIFIPRRRSISCSCSRTSCRVVSPKLRT